MAGILLTAIAGWAVQAPAQPSLVVDGPPVVVATGVVGGVGRDPVTYNSIDHEFLIVWDDMRNTGEVVVHGQRLAPDGSLVGGNLFLAADESRTLETSVAFNPVTDEYLLTWRVQLGLPGSPGFNHTHGQLVSAVGAPITGPEDFSVAGFELTMVANPAAGQAGEYFFSARCYAPGETLGIYGQRISSKGAPAGSLLVETAGAPAPVGRLALDSIHSRYLVTWRDQLAENLMGRVLDDTGGFWSEPFEISSVFPTSGIADGAVFDPLMQRFLVVFAPFLGGPVRAQFISADGSTAGSPSVLFTPLDRVDLSLAYDPVQRVFLVVWHEARYITAQLLSLSGAPLGAPLRLTDVHQSVLPGVAADTEHGGFLVVWINTASLSLYAQHIAVAGAPHVLADGFETGDLAAWTSEHATLRREPL